MATNLWKYWNKNKFMDLLVDTITTVPLLTDKIQVNQSANGKANDVNLQNLLNRGVNVQTGTTYTALAEDHGKIVTLNNGSAVTVTLPNTLPAGWRATFIQIGAGAVTFVAGSGATLRLQSSKDDINAQYGVVNAHCYANADDASAIYALEGNTAAL